MSLRRLVGVGTLLFVGILFAATPSGQQPTQSAAQPQWLFVSVVKVKPGAAAEYAAVQTKEVMPAQRKGGSLGRQAWSSGITGPVGEVVYLSPMSSFAQFDNPNPMTKALGAEGAAALNAKVNALAEQQQTMIVRTRPDLSYVPNPGATSPLAMISVVDVVPGRRGDFEAFLKKEVLPAMQQAKVKSYSVMEVVYGDSINAYVTAVGYDTYDAIGKGHPFQVALGEDGARKLDAKVAGILTRVERFMSRHRPELSWSPQSGSAQ
jgi:hypothetical protein